VGWLQRPMLSRARQAGSRSSNLESCGGTGQRVRQAGPPAREAGAQPHAHHRSERSGGRIHQSLESPNARSPATPGLKPQSVYPISMAGLARAGRLDCLRGLRAAEYGRVGEADGAAIRRRGERGHHPWPADDAECAYMRSGRSGAYRVAETTGRTPMSTESILVSLRFRPGLSAVREVFFFFFHGKRRRYCPQPVSSLQHCGSGTSRRKMEPMDVCSESSGELTPRSLKTVRAGPSQRAECVTASAGR